jgi:hypothetical protein
MWIRINQVESMNQKGFLQGIGEFLDPKMKTFVRNDLKNELLVLLNFYKDYPILK